MSFKVGDVCLLTPGNHAAWTRQYVGKEVKLLVRTGIHPARYYSGEDWWHVQAADGYKFYARECVLQKRPPPSFAKELEAKLLNEDPINPHKRSEELSFKPKETV